MHGMRALLLASLLASPAALALAPPTGKRPGPPEPFPLSLAAPSWPTEFTVGVRAEVAFVVASGGVAGSGLQPPAERRVALNASLGSGDEAILEPNPAVLPAWHAEANATLRFTPTLLGRLAARLDAAWELLPGNASLSLEAEVVKDTLALEGLAAGAPDADLDFNLTATLRSGKLAREPLDWRVEAEHTPQGATEPLRWLAASGSALASPEGEPWSASVRARYGPGLYSFELHAGGARLEDAAARLDVEVPEVRTDNASVPFAIDVEEHPTTLRLASDAVNADGKTKAPGNALITRVVVGDGNGLRDVRRVTFSYYRSDPEGRVLVERHVLEGFPGNDTERLLEDRFATAPMKDASYVAVVAAEGSGSPSVERTFVILDVQPEARLDLASQSYWPARRGAIGGTLTLRDANFGTGPLDATDITELGSVRLTLYKGSVRVAEEGWSLAAAGQEGPSPIEVSLAGEGSRSTGFTYRVRDGAGELAVPAAITIPEGASPGTYRLSIAAANTTIATANFTVEPLPRVLRLALHGAALPGEAVPFEARVDPGVGLEAVELRAPWGATLRAAPGDLEAENGTLRWLGALPLPRPLDDEAPRELLAVADVGEGLVVHAPDGEAVNARALAFRAANVAPRLEAGLRVGGIAVGQEAWLHPHAARELEAWARAEDDNAEEPGLGEEVLPLEAEVRDWAGRAVAWSIEGSLEPGDARVSVAPPQGAERGRYALLLRARDDDGASAERVLAVNLGLRFRLAVLAPPGGLAFAPQPDGSRTAAVTVRNVGNAPASGLAVLAEGLPEGSEAEARLRLPNGTTLALPLAQGFARFEAAELLAPGESAGLEVAVRVASGVAAGSYAGRLVLAGESA